jgi:hypothetical protein
MTLHRFATQAVIWSGRVLFYLTMLLIFFQWAPWIACKPLSRLGSEHVPLTPAPPWAACYTVEHGQIVFFDHRSIGEAPMPFVLMTVALVVMFALSVWSWTWGSGRTWKEELRESWHYIRSRSRR